MNRIAVGWTAPRSTQTGWSSDSIARAVEDGCIRAAILGDEGAFTQLYEQHYDRVYRHVYYRVGRSGDAEDLVQQVFLQAWRALGRYRPTSSPFVAWLLTIAHNAIVSHYRRMRKDESLSTDFQNWASEDRVDSRAEIAIESDRVRRTLPRLRPAHQQVLTMRFLEGLSAKEIAAALGKTEPGVRVIQHRALAELRRLLASSALSGDGPGSQEGPRAAAGVQ
jgi:RNA polymerase sigma-70 factor (ECF subfamily)